MGSGFEIGLTTLDHFCMMKETIQESRKKPLIGEETYSFTKRREVSREAGRQLFGKISCGPTPYSVGLFLLSTSPQASEGLRA